MALKFLNKKGWHTGSLRNIENVWKAEQKHEAEQRKLEELRKQIQDERERSEFRLLQEQAGLVPRQERLEFLYDSGLSVGKSIGSDGASGSGGSGVAFKALEETAPGSAARADGSSSSSVAPAAAKESAAVPGALFEDKPHSANDAWRKLHSDPLLLIRQREQEALARIKNNPVQMALIRKSVAAKKEKGESHDEKEDCRKKHKKHKKHSSSREQFDSEDSDASGRKRKKTDDHKSSKHDRHYHKERVHSEDESEREGTRRKSSHCDSKYRDRSPDHISESKAAKGDGKDHTRKDFDQSRSERHSLNGHKDPEAGRHERRTRRSFEEGSYKSSTAAMPQDSGYRRRKPAPKLSEEERAARLREMQIDAELHEEQRWKRVRKADEDDAREVTHASKLGGRSFLDAAHKSVYGAEKGGSSTIEESVRRRTHYSQRSSGEGNSNAFRR